MLRLNRKLSNHAFESWVLQRDLVTTATTIPLPAPVTRPDSGVGFLATKIRLLCNSLHQVNHAAYVLAQGSQGIIVYDVGDAAAVPVAGAQPAERGIDPTRLDRFRLRSRCQTIGVQQRLLRLRRPAFVCRAS